MLSRLWLYGRRTLSLAGPKPAPYKGEILGSNPKGSTCKEKYHEEGNDSVGYHYIALHKLYEQAKV